MLRLTDLDPLGGTTATGVACYIFKSYGKASLPPKRLELLVCYSQKCALARGEPPLFCDIIYCGRDGVVGIKGFYCSTEVAITADGLELVLIGRVSGDSSKLTEAQRVVVDTAVSVYGEIPLDELLLRAEFEVPHVKDLAEEVWCKPWFCLMPTVCRSDGTVYDQNG